MDFYEWMQTRELVAIFDDNDDLLVSKVGFIVAVSEDQLLLNVVTTRGREDGLYLTQIEDIFKLEVQTNYLHKIAKLIEVNQEVFMHYPSSNEDLTEELLCDSMEQSHILSVLLYNGAELMGQVVQLGEDSVKIKIITDSGETDGFAIINTEEIDRIWCNTGEERIAAFMMEQRNAESR